MQIGSTIDPDGFVYDADVFASTGITQTISGVTVTLYISDSVRARWIQWDAPLYGQSNPQVTGENGYFSFFTPPGSYQLVVNGVDAGYHAYISPVIVVEDDPVRYNIPLWQIKEGYILLPLIIR